ncbi:MAG: cupin domain-containing protein [Reyranellaceae bacterium]
MPVVDFAALPEVAMRDGIAGRWLVGREQGATGVSVLSNVVAPGVVVPRHFHEHEEIVLIEDGSMWVEIDGERFTAAPGRSVIVPARAVHAWGTETGVRILFVWPVLEPFGPGKSTYVDGEPPKVA